MLNNISWGLFIMYTSGALFLYYFVLIVVKGSGWLGKNKDMKGRPLSFITSAKRVWSSTTPPSNSEEKQTDSPDPQQLLQTVVHDLVDEVQAYFSAIETETPKEEIIGKLKELVKKYPAVKESIYEEGINNLIGVSCQHNCSIYLSEDEVSGIWR